MVLLYLMFSDLFSLFTCMGDFYFPKLTRSLAFPFFETVRKKRGQLLAISQQGYGYNLNLCTQ